jgi:hypothetical protein
MLPLIVCRELPPSKLCNYTAAAVSFQVFLYSAIFPPIVMHQCIGREQNGGPRAKHSGAGKNRRAVFFEQVMLSACTAGHPGR